MWKYLGFIERTYSPLGSRLVFAASNNGNHERLYYPRDGGYVALSPELSLREYDTVGITMVDQLNRQEHKTHVLVLFPPKILRSLLTLEERMMLDDPERLGLSIPHQRRLVTMTKDWQLCDPKIPGAINLESDLDFLVEVRILTQARVEEIKSYKPDI